MIHIEPIGQDQTKLYPVTPLCISSIQAEPVAELGRIRRLTRAQMLRYRREAAARRQAARRRAARPAPAKPEPERRVTRAAEPERRVRAVTPAAKPVAPGTGREIRHFFDLARDAVHLSIEIYVQRLNNWGIQNPQQKQAYKLYIPKWLYDGISTHARNWVKAKRGGSVYSCPEGGSCVLPASGVEGMIRSAAGSVGKAMKALNYYREPGQTPMIEIRGRKEKLLALPGRGNPIEERVRLFIEAKAERIREEEAAKQRKFEERRAAVRVREPARVERAAPAREARQTIEDRAKQILRQIPAGMETQAASRRRRIRQSVEQAAREILTEAPSLGQYWRSQYGLSPAARQAIAQQRMRARRPRQVARRRAQPRQTLRARARAGTPTRIVRRARKVIRRAGSRTKQRAQAELRRQIAHKRSVAYRRMIAERGIKRA